MDVYKYSYMYKYLFLSFLVTTAVVSSCSKTFPDNGQTATFKMSNNWWVSVSSVDSGSFTGASRILFTTYNTSANMTDSIWVDDNRFFDTALAQGTTDDLGLVKHGYDFKVEVASDYTNFTFTTGGPADNLYPRDSLVPSAGSSVSDSIVYMPNTPVTVLNGKIFPKGGHSRTGVVTDSIYMQVLFAKFPGDTLTIAGVSRTGFVDDEYPLP
jgi:hypothetical protein